MTLPSSGQIKFSDIRNEFFGFHYRYSGDIYINANITVPGNVIIWSDNGKIEMAPGVTITSTYGNVYFYARTSIKIGNVYAGSGGTNKIYVITTQIQPSNIISRYSGTLCYCSELYMYGYGPVDLGTGTLAIAVPSTTSRIYIYSPTGMIVRQGQSDSSVNFLVLVNGITYLMVKSLNANVLPIGWNPEFSSVMPNFALFASNVIDGTATGGVITNPTSINYQSNSLSLYRAAYGSTWVTAGKEPTLYTNQLKFSNFYEASNNIIQKGYLAGGYGTSTDFKGYGTSGSFNLIESYNMEVGLITSSFFLSLARHWLTSVGSNRKGYFVGGVNSSDQWVATIDGIKFLTESTFVASFSSTIPSGRMSGASSRFKGYWFGGSTEFGVTGDIEGIDYQTETYINPTVSIDRIHSSTAVYSEYDAYIGGGILAPIFTKNGTSSPTNYLYKYNFSGETLAILVNLPSARYSSGGVQSYYNQRGYMMGGILGDQTTLTDDIIRILFSGEAYGEISANLPYAVSYPGSLSGSAYGTVHAGTGINNTIIKTSSGINFSSESSSIFFISLSAERTNLTGVSPVYGGF